MKVCVLGKALSLTLVVLSLPVHRLPLSSASHPGAAWAAVVTRDVAAIRLSRHAQRVVQDRAVSHQDLPTIQLRVERRHTTEPESTEVTTSRG